jgi:hypothetical protein
MGLEYIESIATNGMTQVIPDDIQEIWLEAQKLIVSIRENVSKAMKLDLIAHLNSFSRIFQIQPNETISNHNDRIRLLLKWLQNNTTDNSWNQPIVVLWLLKNIKKTVLETNDVSVLPSIGLVMSEPFSHNGRIWDVTVDSRNLREIILLKIYWIDFEKVSHILSSRK